MRAMQCTAESRTAELEAVCRDALILRELRRIVELPDWTISQRWHGVYPKLAGRTHFLAEPMPGGVVFNGLCGSGMTMSFGLAEQLCSDAKGPFAA